MSDARYIAAWVVADGSPADEFDPDAVRYGHSKHTSCEDAQRAAIENGKRCHVTEWAMVTEEVFNAELGIPRRSDAAWDTMRTWHGDWDNNWEETT